MTRFKEQYTFLLELKELYKKHNFAIGGCGCCDSPYVVDKTSKYLQERERASDYEVNHHIEELIYDEFEDIFGEDYTLWEKWSGADETSI